VTNIKENKKSLSGKQAEFLTNEEKIYALKTLQKNPEDLQKRINKINNLWPANSEVSNFIVNLENTAKLQNITLKNITMSEPKTISDAKKGSKNSKKAIQFSFDTQATFAQNLAIVRSMEGLSRLNSIKQINFTRGDEGSIFMKITGNIYYGE